MGVVGISGALMPSSAQTRHSATTAHSLSALPPHERTGTTPHMRMPHHMDMDMGPHEQITAHPPPRSPHTRTTQSHRIIETQRDPPPRESGERARARGRRYWVGETRRFSDSRRGHNLSSQRRSSLARSHAGFARPGGAPPRRGRLSDLGAVTTDHSYSCTVSMGCLDQRVAGGTHARLPVHVVEVVLTTNHGSERCSLACLRLFKPIFHLLGKPITSRTY